MPKNSSGKQIKLKANASRLYNNPSPSLGSPTSYASSKAVLRLDSVSETQALRSTLLESIQILRCLHARNKNQHRRSHWYRHFGIFRRQLSHLARDLGMLESIQKTSQDSRKDANETPRKKHNGKMEVDVRVDAKQKQQAEQRLEFWRTARLPEKWHAAFSQVVATTQFSPLGMVLIGVLSKICAEVGLTA